MHSHPGLVTTATYLLWCPPSPWTKNVFREGYLAAALATTKPSGLAIRAILTATKNSKVTEYLAGQIDNVAVLFAEATTAFRISAVE